MEKTLTFSPRGLCFQSRPLRKALLGKEAAQTTGQSLEDNGGHGLEEMAESVVQDATEPEKLGGSGGTHGKQYLDWVVLLSEFRDRVTSRRTHL